MGDLGEAGRGVSEEELGGVRPPLSGGANNFPDGQGVGRRLWASLQIRAGMLRGGKRAAVPFRCAAGSN